MSNVLGTINDIRPLADAAHAAGAHVLVDACQAVPHLAIDVQAWDADFVAFTAHKMLGPVAASARCGPARELLEAMPPFLGGGEMIRDVRKDGFTTNEVPWKFEAGTPAIAEAIGLGAAIDYLDGDRHGRRPRRTRCALTRYALDALARPLRRPAHDLRPDRRRRCAAASISFLFDGIHAHDISQVLDEERVCVRAGHHCAKPLMRVLGVPATTRASFYVYNDEADIDALVDALAKAEKFFAL